MKVTNNNNNSRKLNTGCLQKVSSEKKEYVEVLSGCKITENNTTITNFQTDKLLEEILRPNNMNNAYLKVKKNKGAEGINVVSPITDEILL